MDISAKIFAKLDVSAKQYLVVIYMFGFFFIGSCSLIANIFKYCCGFFFFFIWGWGGVRREGP